MSKNFIKPEEVRAWLDSIIEEGKANETMLEKVYYFFYYSNFVHNYKEWVYHISLKPENLGENSWFWQCLEPNFDSDTSFYL